MSEVRKHSVKKWVVSIAEYQVGSEILYKVTRRLPEMSVSETKTFKSKEEAKQQFDAWLA